MIIAQVQRNFGVKWVYDYMYKPFVINRNLSNDFIIIYDFIKIFSNICNHNT